MIKKLICRIVGHKVASTQLSYILRKEGDTDWSRVTTKGPIFCTRCRFMGEDIVLHLPGDYSKVEVIPNDKS